MEDKWKKNMAVIQHFMPALGTRQFLMFSGADALQHCQNCRFEIYGAICDLKYMISKYQFWGFFVSV